MDILNKDDGKKGMFYIEQDGKILAEMSYVWADKKIIIDHTDVSDVLAGKGIGKQLLRKAVTFSRDKNIKVIPLCPFAKAMFDKTEEFRDVLA